MNKEAVENENVAIIRISQAITIRWLPRFKQASTTFLFYERGDITTIPIKARKITVSAKGAAKMMDAKHAPATLQGDFFAIHEDDKMIL